MIELASKRTIRLNAFPNNRNYFRIKTNSDTAAAGTDGTGGLYTVNVRLLFTYTVHILYTYCTHTVHILYTVQLHVRGAGRFTHGAVSFNIMLYMDTVPTYGLQQCFGSA